MLPEKRKRLYKLLEQEIRCEIMARFCPFYRFPEWGEAYFDALKLRDEIRELVFGTSNLLELGRRWKLPMDPLPRERKKDRTIIKEKSVDKSKLKGLNDEREYRRQSEVRRKSLLQGP